MLKKILVGLGIIVCIALLFKFCQFRKDDDSTLDYNTNLIQQQIVNVGKLVVTEGHFTGDDYNKINKQVRANLAKKIANSSLKKNAQNRLISELSKLFILTNNLGWTLKYEGNTIENENDLTQKIKL